MILSVALLEEAQRETGAQTATQTVTTALRELVARRRRERLLHLDLPDLTPGVVETLREARFPADDA